MRDYEHEGVLNDTEVKRQADRRNAEASRVLASDLDQFTENEAFIRWFSRYAYPALAQDFPVNPGSELASFMGKRQLILMMAADMDSASPGFLQRMFVVRDQFERRLEAAAKKEK